MMSLGIPASVHASLHLVAEDLGLSLSGLHRLALAHFIAAADLPPERAADVQAIEAHVASVRPRASARYRYGWQRPAGGSTD